MAQVEQRLLACCAASACASGLPSHRKSGTRLWRRSIDLMTMRSLSSAISANKALTSVVCLTQRMSRPKYPAASTAQEMEFHGSHSRAGSPRLRGGHAKFEAAGLLRFRKVSPPAIGKVRSAGRRQIQNHSPPISG